MRGIVDTRTLGRTPGHTRTRPRATPENPCHTPALPPSGSPYDTSCEEGLYFGWTGLVVDAVFSAFAWVSFGALI